MNVVFARTLTAVMAVLGTAAAYAVCFVFDFRQTHALAIGNVLASFLAAWMSMSVQLRMPSNRANDVAVANAASRYRLLAAAAWLGLRVVLRLVVLAPVSVLVAYQAALPFVGSDRVRPLEVHLFASLDVLLANARWAALLGGAFVGFVVAFASRSYAATDAGTRLASLTASMDGAGASALGVAGVAAALGAAQHRKEEFVAAP